MTRARFPQQVERGEIVARRFLVIAFRIACAALFLPVAWHYMMRGDWIECVFSLVVACVVPAVMAPMD
jgi:hypothetical protein